MHLVRDLLDKSIVDRNGREMGRADRVILEIRNGAPPRVVALETGAGSLAERLSTSFGRAMAGLVASQPEVTVRDATVTRSPESPGAWTDRAT